MAEPATLHTRRVFIRSDFRCRQCGYQIVVGGRPPSCPMCRAWEWEKLEAVALDDAVRIAAKAGVAELAERPSWKTVDEVLVGLAGSGATIGVAPRTFRVAKYDAGWRILLESETTSRWVQLADLRQCWETFERLGQIVRADVLEPARCSAFVMALFRAVPGVGDPAGDATSLVLA
jgi:DNA-directed RNA polymerase subunit RPC12/RpoP